MAIKLEGEEGGIQALLACPLVPERFFCCFPKIRFGSGSVSLLDKHEVVHFHVITQIFTLHSRKFPADNSSRRIDYRGVLVVMDRQG